MKIVSTGLTEEVQRRKMRRDHLCRRQAPLYGVSWATRPQIKCPKRHGASIHRLIRWRVTGLYGRNGVGVGEDAAKTVSLGFLGLPRGPAKNS